MQGFQPRTYKDWLNELNFSITEDQMIKAATNAGNLAMDKNMARHDIALILAHKYKTELKRTAGNEMVARDIEDRYENVAQTLFKSKFSAMMSYVIKNEPDFDLDYKVKSSGKVRLGFVQASVTTDERGNARLPLGFAKKPDPRMDEEGKPERGLGFLGAD